MTDYIETYLHNAYEVVFDQNTTYTFSLLDFENTRLFDKPFAIVTAFNPNNTTLRPQENQLRNKALYDQLIGEFELLEAKGCLDGHCEDGYLIYGISLSGAIELGRKHDQFAIFYNSKKYLKYIDCETGKVIVERQV